MPSNSKTSTSLEALLDTARVVRDEHDLRQVLAQLVALVAELLEMRSVVLNLYRPEWDDFIVSDMRGSEEARAVLLGTTSTWSDWTPLLSDEHRRCGVYFVPAGVFDWSALGSPTYVPPAGAESDPSAWHREDALFAKLKAPTTARWGSCRSTSRSREDGRATRS